MSDAPLANCLDGDKDFVEEQHRQCIRKMAFQGRLVRWVVTVI
jgi:hypothetical protein